MQSNINRNNQFHSHTAMPFNPDAGGSHDNSSLLPFKAGVAVLALGAMADGCPPVRLVPVGLNVSWHEKGR